MEMERIFDSYLKELYGKDAKFREDCLPPVTWPLCATNADTSGWVEVGNKLGIICVDTIEKIKETDEQKLMQNSEKQLKNLKGAFRIREDSIPKIKNQNVYIVDDMVDSRWTFTICGGILLKRGFVKSVTPLAIADTSNQNE